MSPADLIEVLSTNIASNQQCVIASLNLHGMYVRLWDFASRVLHSMRDTYVHIDGMSIVALCRLRGLNVSKRHRVTLNDFIWPLLINAASAGWHVSYVGSSASVLAAGSAIIRERLPHLHFVGHQGYFDTPAEAAEAADAVAASNPQLVLVGMGMGHQERWALDHLKVLAPACVVTVGACMEYIAGEVRTPPRWTGGLGFEWLFRLLEHPSRFWYRYLVEPWFVLGYIVWYCSLSERARNACRIEQLRDMLSVVNDVPLTE